MSSSAQSHLFTPDRLAPFFVLRTSVAAVALFAVGATTATAQQIESSLRGVIVDSARAGITGASIHLSGTALGASSDTRGGYVVQHLAAGRYVVVVRRAGYLPDSASVVIRAGESLTRDFVLRGSVRELERVIISASPRLNESAEQALAKQKNASNIVSVLSGDIIRALPNANAAEAAARIPGVSTERSDAGLSDVA